MQGSKPPVARVRLTRAPPLATAAPRRRQRALSRSKRRRLRPLGAQETDAAKGSGVHQRLRGGKPGVSVYERDLHDLMARSLGGDNAAYRRFLNTLSGLFRAFFRRKLCADPGHAEDLVQETLLAIHLHRQSYDPNRPVTAWVYAIARYKLVDHFRRTPASREFVPIDDVYDLFSGDAPDAADPAHDVDALLERLPDKQSTAIRLVKLEDLTAKEAACRMGISEADVKISIHRGLRKLMALVAEENTP